MMKKEWLNKISWFILKHYFTCILFCDRWSMTVFDLKKNPTTTTTMVMMKKDTKIKSSGLVDKAKKKLFHCTPSADPNVQGWPKYLFFFEWIEKKKRSNCLPKIVFLKISKHETYQKKWTKIYCFIKCSWQALLLCNKLFDFLKIFVLDFSLPFELQNHKIIML